MEIPFRRPDRRSPLGEKENLCALQGSCRVLRRRRRNGRAQRGCGIPGWPGEGKFTAASPWSALHSSSLMAASMSQKELRQSDIPLGLIEQKSASHRLYIARPTAASSCASGNGIPLPSELV